MALRLVDELTLGSTSDDAQRLVVWLEGVLATTHNIAPTALNIEQRLGATSSAYHLDRATLATLYQQNKKHPTIQVKRKFIEPPSFSFRLPELAELWIALNASPTLFDLCEVGQGLTFESAALPKGKVAFSKLRQAGFSAGFHRFDPKLQLHELPTEWWMNLSADAIRYPRSGAQVKIPQILLNYAPASRGPWRLKALIDREGHPVTSRFITVRPRNRSISVEALWAILNSPIANAFAYTHLGKRDNTVGIVRRLPMPRSSSLHGLDAQARAYFNAAESKADPDALRALMLSIDAEVLSHYGLDLELESRLLEVFSGAQRVGVPFKQYGYVPGQLSGMIGLAEFLKFDQNWEATNQERGALIDKKIAGTLSSAEHSRFNLLQAYADYHLEQVAPHPTELLRELKATLAPQKTERDRLTTGELRIVSLVAQGHTNKEIAKKLGTTEHELKNQLYTIFDKIGVADRAELALFTLNHPILVGGRA